MGVPDWIFVMDLNHGPLELVEICFKSEIDVTGAFTVSAALAVLPFTVSLLITWETLPLTLLYVPVVAAVTMTLMVQDAPPLKEPPVRLIEPAPDVAVNVPPQLLIAPFGLATSMLPGDVGNVSENATLLNVVF